MKCTNESGAKQKASSSSFERVKQFSKSQKTQKTHNLALTVSVPPDAHRDRPRPLVEPAVVEFHRAVVEIGLVLFLFGFGGTGKKKMKIKVSFFSVFFFRFFRRKKS